MTMPLERTIHPTPQIHINKFVFLEFILSFRVDASVHAGHTQKYSAFSFAELPLVGWQIVLEMKIIAINIISSSLKMMHFKKPNVPYSNHYTP